MFFKTICFILLPIIASADDDIELYKSIQSSVNAVEDRPKGQFLDDSQVCYEDIGCFSKTGPMKHIGQLPETPEKINTRYFAYKAADPGNAHEILIKKKNTLSVVSQDESMAIIIHGFNNNGQTPELISLKNNLLKFGHMSSVIVVDWAKGAASPWYTEAATNTQVVGRQIAVLVNNLRTSRGVHPEKVHLLGFSLGSQIAGFAGKFSQTQFKWKFGRITALDSAAPLFEGYPGSYLTHADAVFVDAIHSSAGNNILLGQVGFVSPIGHVDFFPNGGAKQPRCSTSFSISCNHYSAVVYMDSSLSAQTRCQFRAFKCNSWADFNGGNCQDTKGDSRMGYASALMAGRGNHYLHTTKAYPYC